MRLTSILLSGYMGFPSGEGAKLEDLGHRSVLIGPNNAGKSTVIRFLGLFQEILNAGDGRERFTAHITPALEWWWQSDPSEPLAAELGFSDVLGATERLSAPERKLFVLQDECRLRTELRWAEDSSANATVFPIACVEGQKTIPVRAVDGRPLELLQARDGHQPGWSSARREANPSWLDFSEELLKSLRGSFLLFEPVRSVTLPPIVRPSEDGSGLVQRMHLLEQGSPQRFHVWSQRLLSTVNRLLGASGMPSIRLLSVRGDPPELWIKQRDDERSPLPLKSMGLGIEQLVILLAALDPEDDSAGHRLCAIEEPENYLHPRLLRHFMHHLGTLDKWQFIVTTHSSDVLDTLGDRDRVYRFSQDENLACCVEPCLRFEQYSAALDSLGLSGGSLLQANAVIWVEGPSDRLYLRRWIETVDALGRGDGAALREGADYSFAYYGGALLAQVTVGVDEEEHADLVQLLRINRFAVIVMDRDAPRDTPDTKLAERKQRIQAEAAKDSTHRRAIVTAGREIENEVPARVLCEAAAARLSVEASALEESLVTGAKPFEVEIVGQLGLSDSKAKTARRRLSDKIPLARIVVNLLAKEESTDHPDYVEGIVDFLRASRCS